MKKRLDFYTTCWKIGKFISYEIYFLPMLRYLHHGKYDKWIQFRWIIFGVNIKL